jgi:adenylate cyclase
MKQKALLATLLCLFCGALGAFSLRLDFCQRLELKALDARFRLFPRPQRASKDVVIVDVDDKSLEAFQARGVAWPWPRDHYGDLVRLLSRAGAKAILFDEFFSEPGPSRPGRPAGQADQDFAAAMREAGNVVLAAESTAHKILALGDNPLVQPPGIKVCFSGRAPSRAGHAVLPLALFQKSAEAVGIANYQKDVDGISRRQHLWFPVDGEAFPQAALATYLTARKIGRVQFLPGNLLAAGDVLLPLDELGSFRIFWYGPDQQTFKHYSFCELAPPVRESAPAKEIRAAFQGKIAIVGISAHGPFDVSETPYTEDRLSAMAEIPATLVSNFLQRDFLVRVRAAVPIAASFLLAALICYLFLYGPGLMVAGSTTALAAAAWLSVAAWLFVSRGLWLDVVAPLATLGLAFAASAAVSYQMEGKARRRLRTVFNRYVSPVVISQILERRESLELEGQEVVGTAFFSDLKDFTGLSEKLPAREVVEFLNEYFSLASGVILENGGLIDKYIGDAIMAVFGAPVPSRTHAAQACAAALELHLRLANSGRLDWATRVGIHSGRMVAGNIGSPQRLDYTAIGDTVNLASRLEGANKLYGTSLLISEAVLQQTEGEFEARELDLLAVKGSHQVMGVYELLGRKGEVPDGLRACKQRFEAGLGSYRARDFSAALAAFEALLAARPGDGPSMLYVERCRSFLKEPPSVEWDGACHLTSK